MTNLRVCFLSHLRFTLIVKLLNYVSNQLLMGFFVKRLFEVRYIMLPNYKQNNIYLEMINPC